MTEGGSRAGRRAREEALQLANLAATFSNGRFPYLWDDLAPSEAMVVRFYDPAADLDRRGAAWGYSFTSCDLADVARFGAGLAQAEAEAWAGDAPHVATRAYEDRRFLLSDRLLHWAVPWLDVVGRCYPDLRDEAHSGRNLLLDLGERHRPAPALSGSEGLHLPGDDSFGPVRRDAPLADHCLSLWSGTVVLRSTVRSLLADPLAGRSVPEVPGAATRRDLASLYEIAAVRWRRMARDQPGSGHLWLDLADRADRTAGEWAGGSS